MGPIHEGDVRIVPSREEGRAVDPGAAGATVAPIEGTADGAMGADDPTGTGGAPLGDAPQPLSERIALLLIKRPHLVNRARIMPGEAARIGIELAAALEDGRR